MATRVFKYPIKLLSNELDMPLGAEVLTVQVQENVITLWAKVDDQAPMERRGFLVLGTGDKFKGDEGAYIGTVQKADGYLIWHVFERSLT